MASRQKVEERNKKPVKQEVTTTMTPPGMPLSPQEEKDISWFVNERYERWREDRRVYEARWQKWYDNYRQILPSNHRWRSKVFDPTTFQMVESIAPRILGALFPEPKFFEAHSKDPSFLEDEPQVETLIEHQLEQAKYKTKFVEIVKQAVIYGTTFAKIPFREEYALRRDREIKFRKFENPRTGEVVVKKVGEVVKPVRKRVYYGPDIEVVDIYDIFADPLDTELSELIHVHRRTMGYLRARAAEGVYKDVHLVVPDAKLKDSSERGAERHIEQGIQDDWSDNDEVSIKEYWGMYDFGEGEEPAHFVMANDNVILLAEPNPYWFGRPPYIWSQYIPVPKELYGIGVPESIASLQKQINEIINQRNDNIALVINRMWKVSTLADVDLKRLSSVPGRIILTSQMDGVEPVQTEDVTSSSYTEVASLKQQTEQATGFSRFAAGIEQGRSAPRAARTVLAFQQASLEKFGMTVQYMEQMLIVPMLDLMLSHNQQFLDDMEYIRVTQQGRPVFMPIDPNVMRGDYVFRSLGSSEIIGREQKLNSHLTFYAATANSETGIDRAAIEDKIWNLMGNRDQLSRAGQQALPSEAAGADDSVANQLRTSGTVQPNLIPLPSGALQ